MEPEKETAAFSLPFLHDILNVLLDALEILVSTTLL